MSLTLTLQREATIDKSLCGHFSLGDFSCYALENAPRQIPAGRYKLSKYWSQLNQRNVLLLNDVPGRSLIEVHPANFAKQLKGCIAPGLRRSADGTAVLDSVRAFIEIVEPIFEALDAGVECWIEVRNA